MPVDAFEMSYSAFWKMEHLLMRSKCSIFSCRGANAFISIMLSKSFNILLKFYIYLTQTMLSWCKHGIWRKGLNVMAGFGLHCLRCTVELSLQALWKHQNWCHILTSWHHDVRSHDAMTSWRQACMKHSCKPEKYINKGSRARRAK